MKHSADTRSSRGFELGTPPMPASQRGVSLIEIMVAMAIGLFILLLISLVYLEGARNLGFRQGQSENLANSRHTLEAITTQFAKAGYRLDPDMSMDMVFRQADANATGGTGCTFARGQAIQVVGAALCIRYQPRDAAETNCAGNAAPGMDALDPYQSPNNPNLGNALFVERYFVNNNTLVCQAGANGEVQQVEVADGVQAIRFEYGIGPRAQPPEPRTITRFDSTPPANAAEVIRSLRYSVLLAASQARLTGGIASDVCDRWVKEGGESGECADDGRLYQMASGALTLRNLMP